jgi:hypothetical protein
MGTARTTSVGNALGTFASSTRPTGSSSSVLVIDDGQRGATTRRWRAESGCETAGATDVHRMRLPRVGGLVHSRHTVPSDNTLALEAGGYGELHKPAPANALVREVRRLDGSDSVELAAVAVARSRS